MQKTSHDVVMMEKLPKIETFTCGKCKKEKTSKNKGKIVQPDGICLSLCNGCYGELLAGCQKT